jgi:hypothetical protein
MKDPNSDRVEAEQLSLFELDPEVAGDELPENFPFLVVSQGTAGTSE